MRALHAILFDTTDKRDGRHRIQRLRVWFALGDGFSLALFEVAPEDEEFFSQFFQSLFITAKAKMWRQQGLVNLKVNMDLLDRIHF